MCRYCTHYYYIIACNIYIICTQAYVRRHAYYRHAGLHTCTYTHMHACLPARKHTHIHTHTHTHTHPQQSLSHTHTHTYTSATVFEHSHTVQLTHAVGILMCCTHIYVACIHVISSTSGSLTRCTDIAVGVCVCKQKLDNLRSTQNHSKEDELLWDLSESLIAILQ